jgi:hypothetical protein
MNRLLVWLSKPESRIDRAYDICQAKVRTTLRAFGVS